MIAASAADMLRDIGILTEPETLLFQDDIPLDPKAYAEAQECDSRSRLERAGCDVDCTPVDTFMARMDFGFASMEDED